MTMAYVGQLVKIRHDNKWFLDTWIEKHDLFMSLPKWRGGGIQLG
jgi:hypothetical protein